MTAPSRCLHGRSHRILGRRRRRFPAGHLCEDGHEAPSFRASAVPPRAWRSSIRASSGPSRRPRGGRDRARVGHDARGDVASRRRRPVPDHFVRGGRAFEGALLAPIPNPRSGSHPRLGGSRRSGGSRRDGAAGEIAAWTAAALLVLLTFSSYALRSWSPRVASLALMGAITVYVTGGGLHHGRSDRMVRLGGCGRLRLARRLGILILPDDPLRSLRRSVATISRCAADPMAGFVDGLDTAGDGWRARPRVRRCTQHLDRVNVSRRHRSDRRRGAVVGGQAGPRRPVTGRVAPAERHWRTWWDKSRIPVDGVTARRVAWSVSSTFHALSVALRDDRRRLQGVRRPHRSVLREHLHDALTSLDDRCGTVRGKRRSWHRSPSSAAARSSPNPSRRRGH